MDILIAIGIAVFMLMLYCCVKAGALEDRIMDELRKEKDAAESNAKKKGVKCGRQKQ